MCISTEIRRNISQVYLRIRHGKDETNTNLIWYLVQMSFQQDNRTKFDRDIEGYNAIQISDKDI